MTQPRPRNQHRVLAALGGIAAGGTCFFVIRAHLLLGILMLASFAFLVVLLALVGAARREREFNRRAAAVFRPSMTESAPAQGIDEVSR